MEKDILDIGEDSDGDQELPPGWNIFWRNIPKKSRKEKIRWLMRYGYYVVEKEKVDTMTKNKIYTLMIDLLTSNLLHGGEVDKHDVAAWKKSQFAIMRRLFVLFCTIQDEHPRLFLN